MAITQAVCNSFKQELMQEEHDLDNDTFKIALFTSSATLGAGTTAYAVTNEVSSTGGTGYTAGGKTLALAAGPALSGSTALVDWDDVAWTSSSFTARGALIYNSTNSNKAVLVLDFGADQTIASGTLTVAFPTADASNAILRIS